MKHGLTVGDLIEILGQYDPDMQVHMSMNMEYQSLIRSDFVEEFVREDGSKYLLITDSPSSDWDDVDYDDGQPDEAQEWYDYDPDC